MNKVAISGMGGFIGTHLEKRLKKIGCKVVGIPTEYLLSQKLLKDFLLEVNPTVIFHLAAYGNHSWQTDSFKIQNNIITTYNVLEASTNLVNCLILNFSSSSVNLSIETEYSRSKKICEILATGYFEINNPVINIRPYSVYGPGESDWRFIPMVIKSLISNFKMILDENATHDWIFIDDLTENLKPSIIFKRIDDLSIDDLLSLTCDIFYEIGTGIKTTNLEVVRMLEEISGLKLRYINHRIREYDNDNWVAKSGVKCKNTLYQGLQKTYAYYSRKYKK